MRRTHYAIDRELLEERINLCRIRSKIHGSSDWLEFSTEEEDEDEADNDNDEDDYENLCI